MPPGPTMVTIRCRSSIARISPWASSRRTSVVAIDGRLLGRAAAVVEAERVRQQVDGIPIGRKAHPAFQGAQRVFTQRGLLRQGFL